MLPVCVVLPFFAKVRDRAGGCAGLGVARQKFRQTVFRQLGFQLFAEAPQCGGEFTLVLGEALQVFPAIVAGADTNG